MTSRTPLGSKVEKRANKIMKEYLIKYQIQIKENPEMSYTDWTLVKATTFRRACQIIKENYPTAYNFENKTL